MGEEQPDPLGHPYVAAQRAIRAGPRASFPFAVPVWTPDQDGSHGGEDSDSESDAWRDSGIGMSTSDEESSDEESSDEESSDEESSGEESSGEDGDEEDEDESDDDDEDESDDDDDDMTTSEWSDDSDSDEDFPGETIVFRRGNVFVIDQRSTPVVHTSGNSGSSPVDGDHMEVNANQAAVDQTAPSPGPTFGPATFPDFQLRPLPLPPRQELSGPAPEQMEIWSYITRLTPYPLPLPSPDNPAHRTLLALLRFPRLRPLPVHWQERLRTRTGTPSIRTLTALARYLGGRGDSRSPS